MKTLLIYLITFCICWNTWAQQKDRRELLSYGISDLSITSDGKIWVINSDGEIHYTKNIQEDWYKGGMLKERSQRITFCDSKHAFVTGYISSKKEGSRKDGYFWTNNAGKTWDTLSFGKNEWIYDAFSDENGNAWMGGSSGNIHYSDDFGKTWSKQNSPYNKGARMHSIFMLDSKKGISGALFNAIYSTENNWKSSLKIKTPYDQNKKLFSYDQNQESFYYDSDHRIEKIRYWGDYIVVNQEKQVFYTHKDKIEWKEFDKKIIDFEVNQSTKKLFVVSNDLKIYSLEKVNEYQLLSSQLNQRPRSLKVAGQFLYILTSQSEIVKVCEKSYEQSKIFSAEEKIRKPFKRNIRHGQNIKWAVQKEQIFLSEDGENWYREKMLDFYVHDFYLLNDRTIILWDGQNNYQYSLNEEKISAYQKTNPLGLFLKFPIQSVELSKGTSGCFHHKSKTIKYHKKGRKLITNECINEDSGLKITKTPFNKEISYKQLEDVLTKINNQPDYISTIKDCKISSNDKKNYLELVKNSSKKKIAFYNTFVDSLDKLDSHIIKNVFFQSTGLFMSTTSHWLKVEFINENNDTLQVDFSYSMKNHVWNLPWEIKYNGHSFKSYEIALSFFIRDCMFLESTNNSSFDKKYLLMDIADFMYNK